MPPSRARAVATVAAAAVAAALALAAAGCSGGVEATPAASVTPTATATRATPAFTPSPAPTEPPAVTIAFVGDLMLARDIEWLIAEHGPAYPFERVLPLVAGADLRIGNMEGTFTERGEPLAKEYVFRTPPSQARTLAVAGFDAVSLANNHSTDFGLESLEDTLDALAAQSIGRFGAGRTEAEARAALMLEAGGLTVALLGYDEIGEVYVARGEQPGVAWADDAHIVEDVAAAARRADLVVVLVHWGTEYSPEPTERQRTLARAAIDAGAAAVVGSHPHVLQPWERHGEGVILYSLGNFVFDLDTEDLETLGEGPFATTVALLTFQPGAPAGVVFRPAYIDPIENRPRPATDEEAARILERLGDGASATGR